MPSDLPEPDLRVRLVAVLGVATGCFQPVGLATATATETSDASETRGATATTAEPVTQGDTSGGPGSTSASATSGSESTSSPVTSSTVDTSGTSETSSTSGVSDTGTDGCVCGNNMVECEEECDHARESSLCTADCHRKWLNVFVTQSPITGMIAEADALKAADKLCQDEAGTAGLPGTYRAWLSDAMTSAKGRFEANDDRPYVLAQTSLVVAASLAALTMGDIVRPIDHDAWGEPVGGDPEPCAANTQVWTGTNPGGASSGPYCLDWTAGNDGFMGLVGSFRPDPLDQWSNCATIYCNQTARLYCFEQRPVG